MNILDQIVESKKKELKWLKEAIPMKQLIKGDFYDRECISLKNILARPGAWGIIAEFKRKSPSLGLINDTALVESVTRGFRKSGAIGLSILTDYLYFGGRPEDLMCARVLNPCPILRKDFIIDEYQVHETKAMGADIILLIASCLTQAKTKKFAYTARSLGLEVLLEIHEERELDHLCEYIDFAGINNRNLRDFKVDVNTSFHLGSRLPGNYIKISESGLQSSKTIVNLYHAGFAGFLMGEAFMSQKVPALECKKLIDELSLLI